jgi:hypothetical protein
MSFPIASDTEIDAVGGGIGTSYPYNICYGPAPRRPVPNYGDMRVNMGRGIGWVFR